MSLLDQVVFHPSNSLEEELEESSQNTPLRSNVHIRVYQRNGKKSITIVEGLADDLDLRKILKALKKTLNTSGFIVEDEEFGRIINLQGDQRQLVANFLCTYHICEPSEIKLHGF